MNHPQSRQIPTPTLCQPGIPDRVDQNCAHVFYENVLNYLEIASLCPSLCMDGDLLLTLTAFLTRLPEKFGVDIKRQIQIYKSVQPRVNPKRCLRLGLRRLRHHTSPTGSTNMRQ